MKQTVKEIQDRIESTIKALDQIRTDTLDLPVDFQLDQKIQHIIEALEDELTDNLVEQNLMPKTPDEFRYDLIMDTIAEYDADFTSEDIANVVCHEHPLDCVTRQEVNAVIKDLYAAGKIKYFQGTAPLVWAKVP